MVKSRRGFEACADTRRHVPEMALGRVFQRLGVRAPSTTRQARSCAAEGPAGQPRRSESEPTQVDRGRGVGKIARADVQPAPVGRVIHRPEGLARKRPPEGGLGFDAESGAATASQQAARTA